MHHNCNITHYQSCQIRDYQIFPQHQTCQHLHHLFFSIHWNTSIRMIICHFSQIHLMHYLLFHFRLGQIETNHRFMHYLFSIFLHLIRSRTSIFSFGTCLVVIPFTCAFLLEFLDLNLKSCFYVFQSFRRLLTPSICLLHHQHHFIQLFLHVKLNFRNFILI